jgi:hypothetical protein
MTNICILRPPIHKDKVPFFWKAETANIIILYCLKHPRHPVHCKEQRSVRLLFCFTVFRTSEHHQVIVINHTRMTLQKKNLNVLFVDVWEMLSYQYYRQMLCHQYVTQGPCYSNRSLNHCVKCKRRFCNF